MQAVLDVRELLRYHRQAVYGLMALAGVLFIEGLVFGWMTELDSCYADRFMIQAQQAELWSTHRSLSSFVFRASVWALLAFLAVLVVWNEDKNNSAEFYKVRLNWNWNAFIGAVYMLLWYGATYGLLTAMKTILGDTSCGKKSNSISGHFSFFYFYGFSLPYVALVFLPYENARVPIRNILNPRSPFHFKLTLLSLIYALYLFGGLFTLSQTWSWGYHSIRQILYGIVFGLASHLVLRHIFKKASLNATRATSPAIPSRLPADFDEFMVMVKDLFPISYLAIFNAVSLVLTLLVTFGFPFNSYEIIGFILLWPALIYAFFYERHGRFNSHSILD